MLYIYIVVSLFVLLQFCISEIKLALNIKTYYTLRELEERDRLLAAKREERKKKRAAFFKKIFRK